MRSTGLIFISVCIGLRRMKMRSVSKRKDIFLSYAHMNIEFARRIQVRSTII